MAFWVALAELGYWVSGDTVSPEALGIDRDMKGQKTKVEEARTLFQLVDEKRVNLYTGFRDRINWYLQQGIIRPKDSKPENQHTLYLFGQAQIVDAPPTPNYIVDGEVDVKGILDQYEFVNRDYESEITGSADYQTWKTLGTEQFKQDLYVTLNDLTWVDADKKWNQPGEIPQTEINENYMKRFINDSETINKTMAFLSHSAGMTEQFSTALSRAQQQLQFIRDVKASWNSGNQGLTKAIQEGDFLGAGKKLLDYGKLGGEKVLDDAEDAAKWTVDEILKIIWDILKKLIPDGWQFYLLAAGGVALGAIIVIKKI